MDRRIIIDNTLFSYFLQITTVDLFDLLRNLSFSQVLIPETIRNEQLDNPLSLPELIAKQNAWFDQIKADSKAYFKLCQIKDAILYQTLLEIIDAGEADAIAQSFATKATIFISDDTKFQEDLDKAGHTGYKPPHIYSSFFVLAYAEVSGLLSEDDYKKAFLELQKSLMGVNIWGKNRRLQFIEKCKFEYEEAMRYKGFSPNKKIINAKVYVT
jgi:predicted nucleic acid-binding protein